MMYFSPQYLGIISAVKDFAKNVTSLFGNLLDTLGLIIDFIFNLPSMIINLISTMISAISLPTKILTTVSSLTFIPSWLLPFIVQGLGIAIVLFLIDRRG